MTACVLLLALAPVEPKGDSPEVKKLLEQQVSVLKEALKSQKALFQAGRITFQDYHETARELASAELELATTAARRREVYMRIYKDAVEQEKLMRARAGAGRATQASALKAQAYRIRAEINLRRAGGKPPVDVKPASGPKAP